MKEKDLKKLGFEKTKVSTEESGDDKPFYYYTYNFKKGTGWGLHLLSNTDDEVENDEWRVEILESGLKPFTDKKDVKKYIKLIEKYETA